MQALKLKGWIDPNGNLRVDGAIALPEGEVELVVWHTIKQKKSIQQNNLDNGNLQKIRTGVSAFQDLFDGLEPVAADFDPDEARWQALKEKYEL
jgi:hypothetical protein